MGNVVPVGFGELVAEMDTDAATDEQIEMYEQMAAIFEDCFETFVQKNLDYNSSFLSAGKVDTIFDNGEGPFDSAYDANLYKVFTRIQDKDQRFYSQAFCNNDDRVGEDVAETASDAATYWMMLVWMLMYGDSEDA